MFEFLKHQTGRVFDDVKVLPRPPSAGVSIAWHGMPWSRKQAFCVKGLPAVTDGCLQLFIEGVSQVPTLGFYSHAPYEYRLSVGCLNFSSLGSWSFWRFYSSSIFFPLRWLNLTQKMASFSRDTINSQWPNIVVLPVAGVREDRGDWPCCVRVQGTGCWQAGSHRGCDWSKQGTFLFVLRALAVFFSLENRTWWSKLW